MHNYSQATYSLTNYCRKTIGLGTALTFAAGTTRLITAIPGISDNLSKSEQYWLCFVSQVLDGKQYSIKLTIELCITVLYLISFAHV